jgi:quercetin dioxygenase-like cupin family protein
MSKLTSAPRRSRWRQNPDSTSGRFEGRDCDSGVSAFIVDAAPGDGPPAHVHLYPETFVVLNGSVRFNVNGSECRASAGDVLTVPAGVAHGFAADAPEGVRLIGIHASAQIAQTFLDDHAPLSTARAGGTK